jgi:hypothetical protein
MTHRKALEGWETKIGNSEVPLQAIWSTAKSLTKWGGPRASTSLNGPLGFKYNPIEKANAIANCLEISSQPVTCVTTTMNGGWRLEYNLCSNL